MSECPQCGADTTGSTKTYCSQVCDNIANAPQMSSAEYHATSALNASRLKEFARSEHKYWALYESPNKPPPKEPTDAMIIGTALHTLVLEPELFSKQYGILPAEIDGKRLNLATVKGKAAKAEIEESGKIALKHWDFEIIKGMAESLKQHKIFRDMLRLGKTEFTWFWTEDGTECKIRIDLVVFPCYEFPKGCVTDVKSTLYSCGYSDASPAGFGKTFYKLGYDIQAGFYAVGAMRLFGTEELPDIYFAAVEKSYPYESAIYKLNDQQLSDADNKVWNEETGLFYRLQRCKKTNTWQGYESGEFITPRWALYDEDDEDFSDLELFNGGHDE